MSVSPLLCRKCGVECSQPQVRPWGQEGETAYAVGWTCPKCADLLADVCPVGPLVPEQGLCLNCGGRYGPAGAGNPSAAECDACGMTEAEALAFFGLSPAAADLVGTAERAFAAGLVRKGVAAANLALRRDASAAAAWRLKYELLSAIGYAASAARVAQAAFAATRDPALLISAGYSLQQAGRHREAVEAYREHLRVQPRGQWAGVAHANMANALRELKDDAAAEIAYRAALDLEPARLTHYRNFARLLVDQKRWREAVEVIDAGIASVGPAPARAAADGQAGESTAPETEAERTEHLIRLHEDRSLVAAEQWDGGGAMKSIERALALGSSTVRTHYLHGRALALLGDLRAARRKMEHVLAMDPKNADALRAVGMIDKALS